MSVHTVPPRYVLAYRIIVRGSPAPQGSKSFKGMRPGKDGRMIANLQESSKAVKPWREAVKQAALQQRGAAPRDNVPDRVASGLPPIDGPIAVRIVFTMPKPQSRPKTRKSWCISAPDLSKLIRSTEDALTDAGIWKDDSRVCEYVRAAKVFPGEDPEALDSPGCVVEIFRVEAGEALPTFPQPTPARSPRRGTARTAL